MMNIVKKEFAKIVLLAIVGILLPCTASSQENSFRKVYSGKLDLYDLQNKKEESSNGMQRYWSDCSGSYQYIDAPDGSRIFDGYFKYHTDSGNVVEGQFKDNKQVGRWKFEYSSGETTIINFVDGIPEGAFVVCDPWYPKDKYKGTIKNGVLCSYFEMDNSQEGSLSGCLNDKGMPINKWTLTRGYETYTKEYDQNGKSYDSFKRVIYDETTGDKHYEYLNYVDVENYTHRWALHHLRDHLFRDSRLKKK